MHDATAGSDHAEGGQAAAAAAPPTPLPPAVSWLARSVGALTQLPKMTPLAALRWTTPEGPMPTVVRLPSRDEGRTVEVFLWLPPHAQASTSERRPCLVDFHGGGFVMGGPLEQAPWCAALARSGVIAISVAYRLGPMSQFPAALHDAEDVVGAVLGSHGGAGAALRTAIDAAAGGPGRMGIDERRVALSGFSSGGNVALNMLLELGGPSAASADNTSADEGTRTERWPSPFAPSHTASIPALLFFPSLDARQAPYERSRPASMRPEGGLSRFIGRTMRNAYLPADKVAHPRASPGLAPTSAIHPSARALLVLPEVDTLAEQSETWVRKLDEAGLVTQAIDETGATISEPLQADGAAVRVHRIRHMSHGFTTYPDAMLDVETRRVKALVMEQARQWVVSMLDGQ